MRKNNPIKLVTIFTAGVWKATKTEKVSAKKADIQRLPFFYLLFRYQKKLYKSPDNIDTEEIGY